MTTAATGNFLNDAFRNLLLRIIVGQIDGPEQLWVGLITQNPGPNVSLEFLESIELQEASYARQPVMPGSWVVDENQVEAVAEAIFRNNSNTTWRSIAAMFLATSRGADGAVVTVVPMRFGVHDLPPEGVINIPIRLDMRGQS